MNGIYHKPMRGIYKIVDGRMVVTAKSETEFARELEEERGRTATNYLLEITGTSQWVDRIIENFGYDYAHEYYGEYL